VDVQGEYYALCPYASRVPYEIWLVHRRHNHLVEAAAAGFEPQATSGALGTRFAAAGKAGAAFHLVVHTAPNTRSKKGELAGYWKTLAEDYHWHIEILPIVEKRSKSYSIKEVYFNAELPEQAAAHCGRWIRIHEAGQRESSGGRRNRPELDRLLCVLCGFVRVSVPCPAAHSSFYGGILDR